MSLVYLFVTTNNFCRCCTNNVTGIKMILGIELYRYQYNILLGNFSFILTISFQTKTWDMLSIGHVLAQQSVNMACFYHP